jgi:hypothetical protein
MTFSFLLRTTLAACLFVICAPHAAHPHAPGGSVNSLCEARSEISEPIAFIVEAEANGFMCPFLTPIFIKELERRGALSVSKDEYLRVHVSFPSDSSITADDLKRIAENVGYEKEKIHVTPA